MSDFFDRLDVQNYYELQEVAIGALSSFLITVTVMKYTSDPSSIIDYIPTIFGSIPGAAIAEGIIKHSNK